MPELLSVEALGLAVDVLRCPVLEDCLQPGGERLGCHRVATWYSSARSEHYVPEPWSGHLAAASILFMSSNPGGGKHGEGVNTDGTTNLWSDERLIAAFDSAFEPGQIPGIADATHLVDATGNRTRAIRYLSWLWYTSKDLLQRDPVPGRDYAATEVVHCGTAGEAGVAEAFATCTARYFRRLVAASSAMVIICTGDWAMRAFAEQFNISFVDRAWGPRDLGGRSRLILQVPHPNRRGTRWSLLANVGEKRLEQARELLKAGGS
jgi:uracil-DNA glycosylase